MNKKISSAQRAVRVFLSSTFRDFTKERDLLVRQVFPTLRARLAERFVDLVDVDLRWGITEQEAERGDVLPICLAEIDRSRPFFIGLLGERYGWVPPSEAYPAEILETHPWLEEHQGGKSVTELEILHGVLNNPDMAGRAMFYFRSPEYSQNQGGDYLPMSAEDQTRQDALKNRIRESDFPFVENYENPQAVANQILEDLWAALDGAFPATDVPDAFTRELLQHEAYAAPRRRIYIGGSSYLDALDQALNSQMQWILLEGESGSGKSALLANWIDRLTDQDNLIVHAHYIGANPSAADPVALVRRLVERIRLETETEDEAESDPEALLQAFPEWLGIASAWAEQNNKRFLFALDSLNGLTDRRELRWLPNRLPNNIHLVVSTLPGEVREHLTQKAEWRHIEVKPLDHETSRQVFTAYLRLYNKTLPEPMIEQVMTHPLVTNPLFLLTLAEELRLFGEHERLSEQIDYYKESETVDDLFERVLARIEEDHGAAIMRQIMTALWAARSGLREEELLAYTGIPLMKWAHIRHALGPALIENTGRYVFSHDYLSIAVSDRYMAGNNCLEDEGQSDSALSLRREAHRKLAEWFEVNAFKDGNLISDTRASEEIPYQWQKANRWDRLSASLTNSNLFQSITTNRDKSELLGYWLAVEKNLNLKLEDAYKDVWLRWKLDGSAESTGDLAANVSKLLTYAGRYTDFAIEMAEFALQVASKIQGEYSPEAGEKLNELGLLQKLSGNVGPAYNLFQKAVKVNERALGPEHPNTAATIANLAILLDGMGDPFDSAEQLFRRAVEINERAFGPEHSSTISSINNLVSFLSEHNDFYTAEPLFRKALEITERIFGSDHPSTANLINNFADLLYKHGDLDAAEQFSRRALAITERALGPDHPCTGDRINSLARVVGERGDLDAEELLLRRALEINQRARGPEDIDTMFRLENLGNLFRKRDDLDAAEPFFRRSLEISERIFGSEDCAFVVNLQFYGVLLRSMGRYDEAHKHLLGALKLNENNEGENSEDVASSLSALGKLYELKGAYNESRGAYNRAIGIRESLLGPKHPKTARLYYRLGELELACGQKASAKIAFGKALEAYDSAFGQDGKDTQAARLALEGC
ncbi:tetratricopeptide repeat protein [Marinobacter sp. S6332]|uniref:tetratricopeptide repeat protein n=1 Tax=Marinobacter sp. S6332 TaxID=2926403 RepID=UPI001FF4F650|nr:tetratricopeptide repeat protein [Marinobacter sp. S6332]